MSTATKVSAVNLKSGPTPEQRSWVKKLGGFAGSATDATESEKEKSPERATRVDEAAAGAAAPGTSARDGLEPIHPRREEPVKPTPTGPSGSGMPVLKQGSSGAAVKDLQMLLNQNGASVAVDGQFGPKTTQAVKDFQAGAGLTADGIVGPKTWDALSAGKQKPPPPPPPKPEIGITIVIVTDERTNNAVKGATVKIGDQEEDTGNTGQASFSLPPGNHSYVATADGFQKETGNFKVNEEGDTEVHVELKSSGKPTGEDRPVLFSTMDEETQKPVVGADVKIGNKSGTTDRKGDFKLTLPEGTHSYSVKADGYKDAKGTIEVAGEVRMLELLQPVNKTTGSVLFSVADETAAKPIEGATIKIGKESMDTASSGFVVFFMPVGKYPYQVTAKGYEDARGTIEITADDDAPQHLELMKPKGGGGGKTGSISFTVADANTAKGIEGATVDINGNTLETGNVGLAVFFMPPGNYPYKVTAQGYEDASGKVDVTEEGETFIEFMLPKDSSGGLTVTVSDKATGSPIDGATVQVGKASDTTIKGGFGMVTFIGLKTGKHPYRVSAKGYKEATGTVDVTNDEESPTPPLRVQLVKAGQGPIAKKGKISVEVVFTNPGEPAKNAVVNVVPPPVPPAPSVKTTNDKGKADFDGLTPGKCTVTAQTPDGSGTATVTISPDKVQQVKIVIARKTPPPPPPPPPPPDLKERIKQIIKEIREIARDLVEQLNRVRKILEEVSGPCKLEALKVVPPLLGAVAAIGVFIAAIAGDATGVGEIVQALAVMGGIGAILGLLFQLNEVKTCLEKQLAKAQQGGNTQDAERLQRQIQELKSAMDAIRRDATRLSNLVNLIKDLAK